MAALVVWRARHSLCFLLLHTLDERQPDLAPERDQNSIGTPQAAVWRRDAWPRSSRPRSRICERARPVTSASTQTLSAGRGPPSTPTPGALASRLPIGTGSMTPP